MRHRAWWLSGLLLATSACGPPPRTTQALPPGVDPSALATTNPDDVAEATGENPQERLQARKPHKAAPKEPNTPPPVTAIEQRTLPTGVTVQIVQPGSGPTVQKGQGVDVHYTGWVDGGQKFDSSRERDTLYRFTLGTGDVIKGWDEGVEGMKVGERRRLTIPPALGYGTQKLANIPPNSTLIFDIELIGIEGATPPVAGPSGPTGAAPAATTPELPADPFSRSSEGPKG